ncbi:hypothetical protein EDB89DRAFT_2244456 [Lactarius sanguifluus]|nr:hypothetical protein EDB89DRAFT_2244456 [Lactarius sanguifluus]
MAIIRSRAHSQRGATKSLPYRPLRFIEHAPTSPQTHPLRTLHIPLSDSSDQDILAHLPTTTSFIRDGLLEVQIRVSWFTVSRASVRAQLSYARTLSSPRK